MENAPMMRRIIFAFVFLALSLPPKVCPADSRNFAAPALNEDIIKKASLEDKDGILTLRVCGTPYEMGYQHGALLKDRIKDFFLREVIGYLSGKEKERGCGDFPGEPLENYFRSKSYILERYIPAEYRQELKGLADGCGLSYDDVVLIHIFSDIASLAKFKIDLNLNAATRDRNLITFYNPQSGRAFVTLGHPAIIGTASGINEKGVALEGDGRFKSVIFSRGIPLLFLYRQVLQYADSYYDAIRFISSSQRASADSVVMTDTRINKSCLIKFDDKRYDVEFTEDSALGIDKEGRAVEKDIAADEIAASLEYFSMIRGELNLMLTQEIPLDPFEFYAYDKGFPEYKLEVKEKTAEYEHYSFNYPSAVKTDYPDNRVFLDFYEPEGLSEFPAVIFVSHTTGGVPQIEGEFCRGLASNGIAALLVQTAYQKNYSFSRKWLIERLKARGADELVELLRQLVIEARRGLDWLELNPKVKKDSIGIMGISLGGILVPVVAGVDDRVNCMGIILGGGDIGEIIWESSLTRIFKHRLIEEGIDSPRKLEERMWMLDPLTFSYKAKSKPAMMINAHFDANVPRNSTLKLWRSLEKPAAIWLPTGHCTSLFEVGYAKIKMLQYFYAQLVDREGAKKMGLDYTPGSPVSAFRFKPSAVLPEKVKLNVSGGCAGVGFGADDIETRNLKLGFFVKELFDRPYFGGSEVFGRQERDDRYRLTGIGGALLLGRRLSENSNAYIRYSYEAVDTDRVEPSSPDEIRRAIGRKGVSSVSFVFERSTYDDILYPIDGSYRNATLDIASKSLGGDFNFIRTTGEATWYITTPYPKITFIFRVKGGWAGEYGEAVEVPFYERFYLGSSDTIRGYSLRYIGPKDAQDKPLGGTLMALGNTEVRFPIYRGLNGAFFFDTGSSWDKLSEIRFPNDLKSSIGMGIRYRAKWTVLRLDYGYPFNRSPGDTGKFHFGFGVPF